MTADEDDFNSWYYKEKWKNVMSFSKYIVYVVDTLGIESDEFKELIKVWGKDYLREKYKKEKLRKSSDE